MEKINHIDAVNGNKFPFKKGKRPPKRSPSVKLKDFLNAAAIPTHPLVDVAPNLTYPMDGNDQWGDCVVAAWDHTRQVIVKALTGVSENYTLAQIVAFYQTQNPLFNPNNYNPEYDNGMDIQTFLEYLVSQKIILGFGSVDYTNEVEMKAAEYIGLAIITGVVVDDIQMTQFYNGVWDYVPNSPVDGGHCVPMVGYSNSPDEQTCVTWGSLVKCTQAFISHQMEEAWFVLLQEHVNHPAFRDSFNLSGFAAAVNQITGGRVVVPTVPNTPTPPSTLTITLTSSSLINKILTSATASHLSNDVYAQNALKAYLRVS